MKKYDICFLGKAVADIYEELNLFLQKRHINKKFIEVRFCGRNEAYSYDEIAMFCEKGIPSRVLDIRGQISVYSGMGVFMGVLGFLHDREYVSNENIFEVLKKLKKAEQSAKKRLEECLSGEFSIKSNEDFYERFSQIIKKIPDSDIGMVKGLCDDYNAILTLFKNYGYEEPNSDFKDWILINIDSLRALTKEFE